MLYLEPFTKRVINYLVAVFGDNPAKLLGAGLALGGAAAGYGDCGIELNILPRLPVVFAVWAGDEEFGPRATVMYDATAPRYLPTEDLVVATAFAVGQLAKAAKRL